MTTIRRALKIAEPTRERMERIIKVINRETNYTWAIDRKLSITNGEFTNVGEKEEFWMYFYEEDETITFSPKYISPWNDLEYETIKYTFGSMYNNFTNLIHDIKKEEPQEEIEMEKGERLALHVDNPTKSDISRILNDLDKVGVTWYRGGKLTSGKSLLEKSTFENLYLYVYTKDNKLTWSRKYNRDESYNTVAFNYGDGDNNFQKMLNILKGEDNNTQTEASNKEEPKQLDTYKLQELFETGVNITEQINYHKIKQHVEEIELDKFLKELKEMLGGK